MFALSGLAIALGLMRFKLFMLVPFAHKFLIGQLKDCIMVFDRNHHLVEANSPALLAFGMDKTWIGKKLENISFLTPVLDQISSEQFKPLELLLTVSWHGRSYETETLPMRDNQNQLVGWLVILRDITERLNMQKNLMITDRLASIGELASGVAHEINNPLTSIVGFSEMMLKQDLPVGIKHNLEIVNSEAQRAARIVKNLLTFASRRAMTKQPVNINTVLEKTLELRAYEQKVANIEVETLFDANLPEIMGDFFQLQEVFINIIINAEYFMQEAHHRGLLIIQTSKQGDAVRVSLADDGPGITPENITHIFDPFFTTKPVGKGTGLGLSICHGIVLEHGGNISVKSEPGKGATFIVELPVSSLSENADKQST